MYRRSFLMPALLTLATGCAQSAPAAHDVSVTDSAGVRMVANGTLSEMPGRQVRRLIFRTGWEGGEPTFQAIRGGALLADGSVAVMDGGAKTLYLISSDGREIGTVGRQGEGPGEFQSGDVVEVLHRDTIIVYDYMLSRLSRFDRRGGFIDSELWDRTGMVQTAPSAVTSSGRLAWIPNGYSPSRAAVTGTEWIQGPLLTSGALGHDVDTVAILPMVETRTENGRPVSDPFVRYAASEAYPEGFIWARNDIPEVKWITEHGDVRQIARWVAELTAVDDSIWKEYEAAYYERVGGSPERGSDSQMATRLRDARRTASSTLPLFRFVHAGSDGSAWVSEYTMFGMPASNFIVFDLHGVGTRVVFSRPFKILDVSGERILGVETDEWGVEAVVVYGLGR